MGGYVNHVVHPAQQPEVAVLIQFGPVRGEVDIWVAGPVLLYEPLRVAVDAPQHRGPGPLDGQVAATAGADRVACLIQNLGIDTREGLRGRAGLEGSYTWQWANQNRTGLGLPPGIHHRAATAADVLPVPNPGLRVNRLTHRTQQAQGGHIVPG